MKKVILVVMMMCMLIVPVSASAQKQYDLEQVNKDFLNVFMAIVYLDEKLENADLMERLKIHMKVYALEKELERLGAIKKELESAE